MSDNRKHRPPHPTFKIREMIKLGQIDEAQACTDENVVFYDSKIEEQQELFVEAQCARMGVKYPDERSPVAAKSPKRRIVYNQ